MTISAFLDRVKSSHIIIAGILFLILKLAINMLSLSEEMALIFNSLYEVILAGVIAFSFLLLYRISNKNQFAFKRTILWMGITMLGWFIGDALYLYLVLIHIDPFISISDISYVASYIFMIIAVLTIPGSQPPSHRRNMVFIEISILVLSAAAIFTVLFLVPGKPDLDYDPLSFFMIFIYPVLDLILLWIIMIMFFTYPFESTRRVLNLLFVSAIFLTVSDFFYLSLNLHESILPDFLADLGYSLFYIFLFLAGFTGYKQIRVRETSKGIVEVFEKSNWIAFLPGVFLIIVIGLLLAYVLNQSFALYHSIVVLIALVIILFIVHQYLVIIDNIKLAREMRLINSQLEDKVEQRTAELSLANTGLLEEMTERKKAEDHLAQINRQLIQVSREKDKLFSIMAHDLRSPLGSIMKLSELLVDNYKEFEEEELTEITGTLNKSATQTFQLLNDLLAWSAIQMGRGERKKETFPICEPLAEVIDLVEPVVKSKNQTISIDVNPDHKIFADRFAIQTVIRNLLSNGLKFTPNGGAISIRTVLDENYLTVTLTDSGIGIPKEKHEEIFKVDKMGSTPGTEGEKGSGFGLLVCKDLVELNGGSIWFESDTGKGTTFFFTVPLQETIHPEHSRMKEQSGGYLEYKCDHSEKLAFTTFIGEINLDILTMELGLIWKSSNYQPDYSVLIDLRQALINLEIKDLPDALKVFKELASFGKNRKFAVLTSTPQQVAFSTMFGKSLKSKYQINVEIFSTYDAALTWLAD